MYLFLFSFKNYFKTGIESKSKYVKNIYYKKDMNNNKKGCTSWISKLILLHITTTPATKKKNKKNKR